MEIKKYLVSDLVPNEKNPRQISKENFTKLKESLQRDPEFLNYRPLIGYKIKEKIHLVGGNMRFRACKDLGYKEIPVAVFGDEVWKEDGTLDQEIINRRLFVDNSEYGKYDQDLLANNFDIPELKAMDIPELEPMLAELEPLEEEKPETYKISIEFENAEDLGNAEVDIKKVIQNYKAKIN